MTDDSRPISLQSFPPGYRIQELGMHKERNLTRLMSDSRVLHTLYRT